MLTRRLKPITQFITTLPLDENFISRLDNATELAKTSELYDANVKLDICLNDGSLNPKLMEKLRGQAFARAFTIKLF
jgi:hypothetical protein